MSITKMMQAIEEGSTDEGQLKAMLARVGVELRGPLYHDKEKGTHCLVFNGGSGGAKGNHCVEVVFEFGSGGRLSSVGGWDA